MTQLTPDDYLEEQRVHPLNHRVGDDPLPEDNESPASDAESVSDATLPEDHPSHDTDVDATERYQDGL